MSEKACTDLMKGMGSPNGQWRPEPEKHTVARKNRSISEVERAIAWALIGCTRPGHFSDFVLTEDYKPAGARDYQRDQGCKSLKTAERVLREVEKLGYFRRPGAATNGGPKKQDTRIFLCADVETKRLNVPIGTCTGSNGTAFYTAAELAQIEGFDPASRARAEALAKSFPKLAKDAFSEAVAAVRVALIQAEYTAKTAVGVKPARRPRAKPAKPARFIQLTLEGLWEPVQVPCDPIDPEPVQAPKAEPAQVPASFMSLDKTLDKPLEGNPPPPPPPSLGSKSAKKAEEDEEDLHPLSIETSRYAAFKALYPAKRFDEAKAKPSFEGLSQSEQDLVIARLPVFAACEQWIRNPRFIPLASNFLKRAEYQSDPPPVLNVAAASNSEPAIGRKDREIRGRIARPALEDLKRGRHG